MAPQKYSPNEIVDRVPALKRFIVSQNKECKVIILTLTMRIDNSKMNVVQKVNEILKNFKRIKYTTCKKL